MSADPRPSQPAPGVVERAKGTSTLTVRITVSRGKSTPVVVVTGPTGFKTRRLTKTTTLRKLPAGTYTVEANQSTDGRIAPKSSARQTVQLAARKSATVNVVYQPTRIRFSLRGSVGIAQGSASSTTGARSSQPQLLTVREDGSTRPAITEGNLSISRYLIVGDAMYADLGFPQALDASGTKCVLVRIPRATGVPACVDSSLERLNWPQDGFWYRNDALQVDASGAVYYTGYLANGRSVLRKSVNGVTRDLVSDSAYLMDFLVLPDGSAVIVGESKTGARWTRLVTVSGALRTLLPVGANFVTRFSDGNVYLGVWFDQYFGVKRYLPSTGQVETKYWISGVLDDMDRDTYFNASEICADLPAQFDQFCGFYGSMISGKVAVAGSDYGLAGSGADSALVKYFPEVEPLESGISKVALATATQGQIVLAGLDAANINNVSIFDPAAGTSRQLLNSATEIEMYELDSGSEPGKVLFAGLRFADNEYVFGSIDLRTGSVEVLSNTGQRWQDFQTFG